MKACPSSGSYVLAYISVPSSRAPSPNLRRFRGPRPRHPPLPLWVERSLPSTKRTLFQVHPRTLTNEPLYLVAMRCKRCQEIQFDSDRVGSETDFYPNFSEFEASAKSGCELCRILMHSVMSNTMAPATAQNLRRSSRPLHITLADYRKQEIIVSSETGRIETFGTLPIAALYNEKAFLEGDMVDMTFELDGLSTQLHVTREPPSTESRRFSFSLFPLPHL
jgi:hypothetical protein